MFQTNIRAHLWDLHDEGIEKVLDLLQGQAGATGITVPLLTGSVNAFRPHEGVTPRQWRGIGGLQFQPDKPHYKATRVPAVTAGWLRKKNPIEKLAAQCEKHGLALRAVINAGDLPAIIDAYPAAATKSVFDDASPRDLCPCNPDVRAFLSAVVNDITSHHPVETVLVEQLGFPGLRRCRHPHQRGFDFGSVVHWLRTRCFCESCRQGAAEDGIEVEAAARSVAVTLNDAYTNGKRITMPLEDFLSEDPIVAAYVRWQQEQITLLVESLAQACGGRLVLHVEDHHDATGLEPTTVTSRIDGLASIWRDPEKTDLADVGIPLVKVLDATEGVEIILQVGSSAFADSATLGRAFRHVADAELTRIEIDHYGEMPLGALNWIHQAARYPKRKHA